MKNQNKNSGITLKKLVFWAATIALFATLIVFILEKSRVTNIYTKPTPPTAADTSTRPVNSVDYSPATAAEQPTSDQKTQDVNTQNKTPKPSQPIGITLSAATQDNPGGPVIIRTILSNVNGGTCAITLTKDSLVKSYSADIVWSGNYYSCGKDIPFSDISVGTWQLKVVANQNNSQGSADTMVDVKAN